MSNEEKILAILEEHSKQFELINKRFDEQEVKFIGKLNEQETKFNAKLDEHIASLNAKTFNHNIRISALEDTLKTLPA